MSHQFVFVILFFFFNDTATTEIYTLSLHDALPICVGGEAGLEVHVIPGRSAKLIQPALLKEGGAQLGANVGAGDRKSTRLNSSHGYISYAVFCLKKKKNKKRPKQNKQNC